MLVRSPAEAPPLPLEAVLERVPFSLRAPALLRELLESLALLTLLLLLVLDSGVGKRSASTTSL